MRHQRGLEMKLTHLGHIIWGNVLRGTNTPKKDGLSNWLSVIKLFKYIDAFLLFCFTRLISIGNERVRQAIIKKVSKKSYLQEFWSLN